MLRVLRKTLSLSGLFLFIENTSRSTFVCDKINVNSRMLYFSKVL